MQPINSEQDPIGSFQTPIAVPQPDPDSPPLLHVDFSAAWGASVLGSLLQLLEQATWDTTDTDALTTVQLQANTLIQIFQEATPVFLSGMVISFAGSAAPDGWLMCDGSAVSRDTYSDLFTAIGITYGAGDGSTTFNVPDLRGRVEIGVGQQSGGTDFTLGLTGGEEVHTLTVTETPAHSHSDTGHTHGGIPTFSPTAAGLEVTFASLEIPLITVPTGVGSAAITATGGDGAHNNIQPYIALNAIIRW